MEIYLAGKHPVKNGKDASWEGLNILETFYYLQKNKEFPRLISHFDSVDSTAWLYGNMSGSVYKFDANNGIMNTTKAPKGKQLISKAVALNNFTEWVRFQKYARIRL